MPAVCKTCSRKDVEEVNKLLAQGASFRNIVAQVAGGATVNGLKRHKDNCIPELVAELVETRRVGLLADVDDVRSRIKELESQFADNPQAQVQLVARRLDAIDKEAKLTGAYTKEQENSKTIEQVLGWFNDWLTKNPKASSQDKAEAIAQFARGGQIDPKVLADRIGVPLVSNLSQ